MRRVSLEKLPSLPATKKPVKREVLIKKFKANGRPEKLSARIDAQVPAYATEEHPAKFQHLKLPSVTQSHIYKHLEYTPATVLQAIADARYMAYTYRTYFMAEMLRVVADLLEAEHNRVR